MNDDIKLSVRLMTYNHSQHILECLASIEKQQTSFTFEVVIGDDFSSDNNVELINRFISTSKNDKINYLLLNRIKNDNYDTKRQERGRLYNFINIIDYCNGKYIALLDGDDYWTDPYKLQKQVDFLEANHNFNICFTRTDMLKNNELELHPIPEISVDGVYTYDDLLAHNNFMATASVVFRKNFTVVPDWFYQLPSGDMGLYLITCKTAKIKCLADKTTVYRIHEQGIWSGISKIKKLENYLLFYQTIYAVLSSSQKIIVLEKHKKLIEKISYLTYSTNGLLRVLNRIQLNLKFPLK